MRTRVLPTAPMTDTNSTSKMLARVLLFLFACAMSTAIASPAMAQTACWGYVVNTSSGRVYVGSYTTIESARSAANQFRQSYPGYTVIGIYNRCERRWYSLGSTITVRRNPTRQYVDGLISIGRRVQSLIAWARRNRGNLTDGQFNYINRYASYYNSRLASAKRSYPHYFRNWNNAPLLTSSYKRSSRVYYIQYSSRTSLSQWRTLQQPYRSYTSANVAMRYYISRYGSRFRFRVRTVAR